MSIITTQCFLSFSFTFVVQFSIVCGLFVCFSLQRKRKGPVPLPIEESRARRQATRAKFREKKRAEKREAQQREAQKGQAEEPSKETAPDKQQSMEGAEAEAEDDMNDEEDVSSESKKSPRVRKAVSFLCWCTLSVAQAMNACVLAVAYPKIFALSGFEAEFYLLIPLSCLLCCVPCWCVGLCVPSFFPLAVSVSFITYGHPIFIYISSCA